MKINLFVIVVIGLAIPVYYKTKSYLLGIATIEQIFTPMIFYDFALGFGLGVLAVGAHEIAVHLMKKYFSNRIRRIQRFFIQFFLSTAASIAAIYLFTHLFYTYVVPYYQPKADFYLDMLVLGLLIPVFISGVKESLFFYGEWENEIVKKEKLEKENIKAQYEVLKNQINPHFLFNCFNTLTELAHEDKALTIKFIQQLSKVYRFVLENRELEVVELKNEIHVLESYVFLQQIRFGETIHVDIKQNVLTASKQLCIVPLTLQILMENAIKHNVASREQPLHITIEFLGNNELIFRNNLQQKKSVLSTNMGLKNIISRYEVITEKTVKIVENATEFIVKVPLIKVQVI